MQRSAIVLAAISMAVAGCTANSGLTAAKYSAADEAAYLDRFNALSEGGSGGAGLAGAYDPLEPVAGAANAVPLPVSTAPSLSASALATATDYAAQRNSAALIVWRNGAIEAERYFGEANRDTLINSKSLAKPITALAIGRAIQQGYISSLDQKVSDFITEWRSDPERSQMRIRHLLDMRSGFIPQAMATSPDDILNRAYLHPRHDEVIINEMPLANTPGTRYEYANATSEIVAPVIERATGMRYGEFLSEALLKPIGAAGGEIWVNRPGGTAHSGCCVLLPAQTYLRMAVLALQDGVWAGDRLLPEGYVSQMRTGTAENPYYGLGLWLPLTYVERRGYAHPEVPVGKVLHSEPYLDRDIALFDGNGNQVAYMIPSANMVILRVGNRPPQEAEWDNSFLPNLLIRDAFRTPGAAMPEPQPR